MEKILLFALIGLGAQLVDGTLGMAFGVTATTLFTVTGTPAATASAVVHVVQVGTTAASGVAHWRLGNVDLPRVLALGGPGAVGAYAGASLLGGLDASAAAPVTSSILLGLGLWVTWRFARGGARPARPRWGPGRLAPLGLLGGLLDATGGGGWGPVTTSTLLSVESGRPRGIIGTVSAAEFLVTCAAVAGFAPLLREEFAAHAGAIAAMLAGGVAAAPVAAALVGRANPRLLGIVVGAVLVALNLRALLAGALAPAALGGLLAGWAAAVAALLGLLAARGAFRRPRVDLAAPGPDLQQTDRYVYSSESR